MKKIIIDVDTGVDDAQAIMVALADPNVEVLAITCCFGNTALDNALKNTLRVLKVCKRLDVRVERPCGDQFELVILGASPFTGTVFHTLHRSQYTVAVQGPCWPVNSMLGIITARTGWVRSQIQTLQAWSCCRRRTECSPC